MTTKSLKKIFTIFSTGLFTTALTLLAPQAVLAHGAREGNITAVNSLTKDSAQYKLNSLYFENKGKELLFIGSNHTFDPADPQITGVEALFKAFEPTLVLIEGGDWPIAANKSEAVLKYGELGFTRFLATNAKTKAVSADAPLGVVVAEGLKRHSPVDTKLYFALRLVPQWAKQQTGKSIEENMREYLASPKFNSYFPANTQPNNIEELVNHLANRIPALKDWKSIQFNMAFDGGSQSMLNDVDLTVNTFRNNYFKEQIFAGLRKGERVFVIAGHTHLGKIAPLFSRGLPPEAE